MEYFLRLCTLGKCPTITIDNERFELLKISKHILDEALALEEEYEMVIRNYTDLEKEAINVTILYMTRGFGGYVNSFDMRLSLNICFMNMLTSARLYIDKLAAHCAVCLPKEKEVQERISALSSAEYDKDFDYRFMEALRNYIQHYDTAVHHITCGGRWTSTDDKGLLEYSSCFTTDKNLLTLDSHFKKKVLEEMPDKVDLISASRGYIESLSSIHNSARQMISSSINEARTSTQVAIDDYRAVFNKGSAGLTAYKYDGDNKIDEVPVFLDWDDVRIELEKRNLQLVNLKKRYTTGQVGLE